MVSFAEFSQRGSHNWIVRDLRQAQSAAASMARGISGPRLINNVTSSGHFIGEATETMDTIKQCLKDSGRLFRQGNSVVFLTNGVHPGGACVARPLVIDGVVTKTASAVIGNVVYCREMKANSNGKGAKVDQPLQYPVQFAVPQSVLQQVVVMDHFMEDIPEARFITSHPVFDNDFAWLDVGYHESQHILVCGDSFDPAELIAFGPTCTAPATIREVLDRLPPLIREWVRGFHWNSPVDLINYIAGPLMTVLMPLFVEAGHPAMMFWGNKPNIGKSLAAQCLAILKDGEQAGATSIDGGSREIENLIASDLNDGRTTLFIDNQKGKIDCSILEANITCAQLGFRGMFTQSKIRRPNDVLWLITTNEGSPSDDLLSRCIHIRLHYEGDPNTHQYRTTEDEIVQGMKANRAGILAEAAGMVRVWLDTGRPRVHTPGRFEKFSNTIGSILAANGLPGFLSNARAEIREHSTKLQQLTAIAERVIDDRAAGYFWEVDCPIEEADDRFKAQMPEHAMEPKDWVGYLTGAGVIPPTCNTSQKQKVSVTDYMKTVVKVPLEVVVGDSVVQVTMVSRPLRSRRTAYALAVHGLAAAPAVEVVDDSAATLDLAAVSPVAAEGDAAAGPAAAQPSPELPSGEPDEDGDVWGV